MRCGVNQNILNAVGTEIKLPFRHHLPRARNGAQLHHKPFHKQWTKTHERHELICSFHEILMPLKIQVKAGLLPWKKMTILGTLKESQQHIWFHISWFLWTFTEKKKKETGSCIDMCSNPNFYIAWKRKEKRSHQQICHLSLHSTGITLCFCPKCFKHNSSLYWKLKV